MSEATYTSRQVAELTGITYPTLMKWAQQGIVEPVERDGKQNHPVTWSRKNLRELGILSAARRAGISLQRMKEIMLWLRGLGFNPLSQGSFMLAVDETGKPVELLRVTSATSAMSLLRRQSRGQMLLPLSAPEPKRQAKRASK